MVFPKKALLLSFVTALTASPISAAVDSTFHIYLLFGQSNMAGGGAGNQNDKAGLLATDCDTNTRIKTLAFCNCATTDYSLGCTKYKPARVDTLWYTAFQPLHICSEGISPGMYFARTMLDSIRSDIKIGLIPCALSGQALKVFYPGGSNFAIPNWAHPTLNNSSPYAWMLARCKRAQQTGVIKGILLHQGESGQGSPPNLTWVAMCTAIIDSLKKNLVLPSTLPVVVGELRQDATTPTPCCAGFNTNIDQFASQYPNCGLASSAGLSGNGVDPYHFNCASMRELGRRYALALLAHASASYIPRKGTSVVSKPRAPTAVSAAEVRSWAGEVKVYSLDGKFLTMISSLGKVNTWPGMRRGKAYLVTRKSDNNARLMVIP
jgi:hypothetical protein